jgi:hypothetical protein
MTGPPDFELCDACRRDDHDSCSQRVFHEARQVWVWCPCVTSRRHPESRLNEFICANAYCRAVMTEDEMDYVAVYLGPRTFGWVDLAYCPHCARRVRNKRRDRRTPHFPLPSRKSTHDHR